MYACQSNECVCAIQRNVRVPPIHAHCFSFVSVRFCIHFLLVRSRPVCVACTIFCPQCCTSLNTHMSYFDQRPDCAHTYKTTVAKSQRGGDKTYWQDAYTPSAVSYSLSCICLPSPRRRLPGLRPRGVRLVTNLREIWSYEHIIRMHVAWLWINVTTFFGWGFTYWYQVAAFEVTLCMCSCVCVYVHVCMYVLCVYTCMQNDTRTRSCDKSLHECSCYKKGL